MVTLPIEDYSNANGFDKEVKSEEKKSLQEHSKQH